MEVKKEIPDNLSRRKDRVMVKVDCSSLPSSLIESELFGREKGAYTGALTKQVGRFELAHGSTLFLDEIGELPLTVSGSMLTSAAFPPETIRLAFESLISNGLDIRSVCSDRYLPQAAEICAAGLFCPSALWVVTSRRL